MTLQLLGTAWASCHLSVAIVYSTLELVRQICSLRLCLFDIFGYRSTCLKTMSEEGLEYDAIIQDGPKKVSM